MQAYSNDESCTHWHRRDDVMFQFKIFIGTWGTFMRKSLKNTFLGFFKNQIWTESHR